MAWNIELDLHALGQALEVEVKHGYYYDVDNYYDYNDGDFDSVADY